MIDRFNVVYTQRSLWRNDLKYWNALQAKWASSGYLSGSIVDWICLAGVGKPKYAKCPFSTINKMLANHANHAMNWCSEGMIAKQSPPNSMLRGWGIGFAWDCGCPLVKPAPASAPAWLADSIYGAIHLGGIPKFIRRLSKDRSMSLLKYCA